MANEIFPIELLFDAVTARFATEGTSAANVFGWQRPGQQVEGNRIAWVPGDASGVLGATTAPRNPGRNPRPLATVVENFTITISAADTTAPDDERAQYRAARTLRDAWHRAVYLAMRRQDGTLFNITAEKWVTTQKERRYGAAIELTLQLESMVPDMPRTLAPANISARIAFDLNETADDPPIVVTNEP